jgi:hypothetical protein
MPIMKKMKAVCICGKEFDISEGFWVLPNHTDKNGVCPGSLFAGKGKNTTAGTKVTIIEG